MPVSTPPLHTVAESESVGQPSPLPSQALEGAKTGWSTGKRKSKRKSKKKNADVDAVKCGLCVVLASAAPSSSLVAAAGCVICVRFAVKRWVLRQDYNKLVSPSAPISLSVSTLFHSVSLCLSLSLTETLSL